jgi:hypothetical protein
MVMLRITTEETSEAIRFRLEGYLKGAWVSELERLYLEKRPADTHRPVVLDIENLTGADAAGRNLLTLIHEAGGRIEHTNPLTAHVLLNKGFSRTVETIR